MSDPWRCDWCGRAFPVPVLTKDHQQTCPNRPKETKL